MNPPNKLSALRESWNLSQDELGLLLNMSRQNISRIEISLNKCTIETALLLEMLFGVPAGIRNCWAHLELSAFPTRSQPRELRNRPVAQRQTSRSDSSSARQRWRLRRSGTTSRSSETWRGYRRRQPNIICRSGLRTKRRRPQRVKSGRRRGLQARGACPTRADRHSARQVPGISAPEAVAVSAFVEPSARHQRLTYSVGT